MKDIALILTDTSRSKVYLAMLEMYNLLPNYIIYLRERKRSKIKVRKINNSKNININFDFSEKLKELPLEYEIINTKDIHNKYVIKTLKNRKEKVFIYSGYGGVILKKHILAIGKKFLHVHGGYIPNYKGSTTNYYSIIEKNKMGASAIFLNEKIDSGPIIDRKIFSPPKKKYEIDYFYDSYLRGLVLVNLLKKFKRTQKIKSKKISQKNYKNYFIIHPVLKHIALLK